MTILEQVASLLLTYLIHSTALIACAAFVGRYWRRDDLGLHGALWRVALLGGLITGALHAGWGLELPAGALNLGAVAADAPLTGGFSAAMGPAMPSWPRTPAPAIAASPASVAVGLWILGVAFVGLRLAHSYVSFRRSLVGREDVVDPELLARLREVLAAARVTFEVRLTFSHRLRGPIAFGLRQPEICVPVRILSDLDAEQQRALLAHEVAHLVHRDALWLGLYSAISTLCFFQPLNWIARRRLLALSELAADGWAVRKVADPLALASCLSTVADWVRPSPVPALAHAMAGRRSDLALRIERMLEEQPWRSAPRGGAVRTMGVALLVLCAVALVVPGISLADKPAKPAPAATTAPRPARPARTALPPAPPAAATSAAFAQSADSAQSAESPESPESAPSVRSGLPPADADDLIEVPTDVDVDVDLQLDLDHPELEELTRAVEAEVAVRVKAHADEIARAVVEAQTVHKLTKVEVAAIEAEARRLASANRQAAHKSQLTAERMALKAQTERLRASAQAQAQGAAQAAIEEASRHVEAAARELAEQRRQLDQERRQLQEEAQRLSEARERLRQERGATDSPSR